MNRNFSLDMSLRLTKCYLVHKENPDKKIYLPHKVRIPIGTTCYPLGCPAADAYVFATADVDEMTVAVENMSNGTAWSGDRHLDLGSVTVLLDGDELALEDGEEAYIVKFTPYQPNNKIKGIGNNFKPAVNIEMQTIVNYESKSKTTDKCAVKKSKRRCRGKWENVKNSVLIYTPAKLKSSSLIAGFGLIGTLVKVKDISSKRTQWNLAFNNLPEKLKHLQQKGYKIAIFSENVLTEKLHLKIFKKKICVLLQRIGVPVQVFMAIDNEHMKKPVLGMWQAQTKRNQNILVDTRKSFYVGCYGGRKQNWAQGKKPDPSNEDRLFAVNIGVKFFTPEEYFQGTPVAPYCFPKFNPREPSQFDFKSLVCDTQEVVLMVGPPDSGKTWICKKYLVPAGYVHISINFAVEMLRGKCIIKDFLTLGKKVVIDGMNPSSASRKLFINIARKRCIPVRCFEMKVSNEQLAHNRKFRLLTDMKDGLKEDSRLLAFDTFYQKPDLNEGFQEIVHVPFVPDFEDPQLNRLYRMFLLPN